jgi:histidinol phosphatase-like PHP family hydrolase
VKLYDQHLHSRHSVDSKADPVANCEQALGGRAVSIGSDAHHSSDVGAGFGEVAEQLQAIGFEGEAVFRERVRSTVAW